MTRLPPLRPEESAYLIAAWQRNQERTQRAYRAQPLAVNAAGHQPCLWACGQTAPTGRAYCARCQTTGKRP